jgi:hypothetical protein
MPVVVHRLIWKTRSGAGWRLRTKADARLFLDDPLMDSGVIGKVTAFQPLGGRWTELDSPGARVRHVAVGLFSTLFYRWEPELRLRAGLDALAGACLRCPLPGAAGCGKLLLSFLSRREVRS